LSWKKEKQITLIIYTLGQRLKLACGDIKEVEDARNALLGNKYYKKMLRGVGYHGEFKEKIHKYKKIFCLLM